MKIRYFYHRLYNILRQFILKVDIDTKNNKIAIRMTSEGILKLCFDYPIKVLEDLSKQLKKLHEQERKQKGVGKEFKQTYQNMAREIYVHMFLLIFSENELIKNIPHIKSINRRALVTDIGTDFAVDSNSEYMISAYNYLQTLKTLNKISKSIFLSGGNVSIAIMNYMKKEPSSKIRRKNFDILNGVGVTYEIIYGKDEIKYLGK